MSRDQLLATNRVLLAVIALPAGFLLFLAIQRESVDKWPAIGLLTLFLLAAGTMWLFRVGPWARRAAICANAIAVIGSILSVGRYFVAEGFDFAVLLAQFLVLYFFGLPLVLLISSEFGRGQASTGSSA
jgi:hypothetical protein